MTAVGIKIGLGVVSIIALFEVLQTQAVVNAVLLFGAAGVVPGTDIVLSPEATLWAMAGVLLASCVLIFHRELIDVLMRPRLAEPETGPAEPVVVAAVQDAPARPRWQLRLPAVSLRPAAIAGRQIAISIYRGAKWLVPLFAAAGRHIQQVAGTAYRHTQYAWRWLRPRMVHVDQWATRKLVQSEALAACIDLLSQCPRIAVTWWANVRRQAGRYLARLSR
jgi:hypothetical protein